MRVDEFLKQKRFAVVGSFRNKSKPAHQILKTLESKGYRVCAVNPGITKMDGIDCYPGVGDIPHEVDVVDIVMQPAVAMKILEECKNKGIKRVWLQPGAESQEAISYCQKNGIEVVHGLCLMRNPGMEGGGLS